MIAAQIEVALTGFGAPFYARRWVVVPNVSWGWDLDYEADLIAVSKSGWASEIEIKVSKSDLKHDSQKRKFRRGLDGRIKKFWYAVPKKLSEFALTCIPDFAGLLEVEITDTHAYKTKILRSAKAIESARKPTDNELEKLKSLGCMKLWNAKAKLAERQLDSIPHAKNEK